MATIVCSNCGYKNKASTMICTNCGNLLSESQPVFTNPESVPAPVSNIQNERTNEPSSPQTGGTMINISSRKGIIRWIPQIISAIVLVIFIVLEYLGQLPYYSFYVFLIIIFILPSLMRGIGTGIKFSAYGFRVEQGSTNDRFNYSDIENAKIDNSMPGLSSMTLSFSNNHSPVTMNFDSVGTFRMLIMQLRRRRIPVSTGEMNPAKPEDGKDAQ